MQISSITILWQHAKLFGPSDIVDGHRSPDALVDFKVKEFLERDLGRKFKRVRFEPELFPDALLPAVLVTADNQ